MSMLSAQCAELRERAQECATCTERQGYYLDAETIANQRQRIADLEGQVYKLKSLNGELCAEVNEKTKKIRKLESLARDMARVILLCRIPSVEVDETACRCMERMEELGIEG